MPPEYKHVRGSSSIAQGWGAAKRNRRTPSLSSKKGAGGARGGGRGTQNKAFRWGIGLGNMKGQLPPYAHVLQYKNVCCQRYDAVSWCLSGGVTPTVIDFSMVANVGSFVTINMMSIYHSSTLVGLAIAEMSQVWVNTVQLSAVINSTAPIMYKVVCCSGTPDKINLAFLVAETGGLYACMGYFNGTITHAATKEIWLDGIGHPCKEEGESFHSVTSNPIEAALDKRGEVLYNSKTLGHNPTHMQVHVMKITVLIAG
ncbi:hypothetical protein BDD12DRAFT_810450 [Trichophaea hybrida]|nr:hypothetical protein BDD12DRAFT_810450 [Trichophaea hybrida]